MDEALRRHGAPSPALVSRARDHRRCNVRAVSSDVREALREESKLVKLEHDEQIGSVVSAAIKQAIENAAAVADAINADLTEQDILLCIHSQIAQWVGRVEIMLADTKSVKLANVVPNRNRYMKAGREVMAYELSQPEKS